MQDHATHPRPISPPLVLLLTTMALALSSVTALSVGLAIDALIDDRLLAVMFAGAAVLLDLFKYAAWPLSLHMLSAGRLACAGLLIAVALVMSGISGWATFDRLMSSIVTSRAQQQAIQEQRIADLDAGRSADTTRLVALDDEARSIRAQATELRDRGMVSKAAELESAGLARVGAERDQVLARLDRSSLELTDLRSTPAKAVGLPLGIATLLCIGFALALEVVPALILSAIRQPLPASTAPLRNPAAPALAAVAPEPLHAVPETIAAAPEPQPETPAVALEQQRETPASAAELHPAAAATATAQWLELARGAAQAVAESEVEPAPDNPLTNEDAELLETLLQKTASAGPGEKITVKGFARAAKVGNTRAGAVFRAAETIGAIRRTPAGYIAAG